MPLDDAVLRLQSLIDRIVRRLRLGPRPARASRRLLIVQIDGLPRSVFEEALANGRMPFTRRLLDRQAFRTTPMNVGLPTSTPAFQMAAMYGVRPDIPGFHYHDKQRHGDVYFPRAGDAAHVEATQARDRFGIVDDGSTYGCVFTGGAASNLFSFSMLKQPSGAGVLRLLSTFVVLLWVVVKCVGLTAIELLHAVLRLIADPVSEVSRGWKWLAIKVGLSVWVRQFFTLAVSADLYRGVPAIYVNYLDYDVFAHAYGPRHRRAFHGLRVIDASMHQLWNVLRRVPEHEYDLYILSDHGQAATIPYQSLTGARIERRLFDEFFDPSGTAPVSAATRGGRRLLAAVETLRAHRRHGLFQRFLNYLERDFISWLGDVRETHERAGVRVVAAGPNAFVYFMESPEPLTIDAIDQRSPGIVDELSRSRGIGFVLARSAAGPVCIWRGKRYGIDALADGPFAGRPDLDLVASGIRDLMAMRCAGDLVLYGLGATDGDVSFIGEQGAHAGPTVDEMQTFIVHPADAPVPSPVLHPIQLYDVFVRYRRAAQSLAA
ncbi:MAG: alkaline phosphatase family protein [Candidatus Rokubacteria bacterium]|nr:alkaline phosphatase family protein [Candidatus Rokubacteria bacterium]